MKSAVTIAAYAAFLTILSFLAVSCADPAVKTGDTPPREPEKTAEEDPAPAEAREALAFAEDADRLLRPAKPEPPKPAHVEPAVEEPAETAPDGAEDKAVNETPAETDITEKTPEPEETDPPAEAPKDDEAEAAKAPADNPTAPSAEFDITKIETVKLLDELIRRTKSELARPNLPAYKENALKIKLSQLHFADNNPIAAFELLKGMESPDPLFADVALLKALALFKTSPNEVELAEDCLKTYVQDLSDALPLKIVRVEFISSFFNFGIFNQHDTVFSPGDRVGFFIPLENFVCERDADTFKIEVVVNARILDAKGEKEVHRRTPHRDSLPKTSIPIRFRLRDYCPDFTYILPNDIPDGEYLFEIEIADTLAKYPKPAKKTVSFTVRR